MKRASTLFSEAQRKEIEAAVASAETKTSAEIVPVVATASGRYDRAEDIAGLFLGALLMGIAWFVYPRQSTEPGSWGGAPAGMELIVLLAAMLIGFVGGAGAASRIHWLRALFTPRAQMQDEVRNRARQVFFDQRVHHTASSGGLLIYISLFERTAVLLADSAVLEKFGQSTLDTLRDQLVQGIRGNDIAQALTTTIRNAGDRLALEFPSSANNVNELGDTLILID